MDTSWTTSWRRAGSSSRRATPSASTPAATSGRRPTRTKRTGARDPDGALLVGDIPHPPPIGYDTPWAVHACLFAYGVALLDNAQLEPLARACVEEKRDEFMLVIAPLNVVGGTGSPANPLAVF